MSHRRSTGWAAAPATPTTPAAATPAKPLRILIAAAGLWGIDLIFPTPVEWVAEYGKLIFLGIVVVKMAVMGVVLLAILLITREFGAEDLARVDLARGEHLEHAQAGLAGGLAELRQRLGRRRQRRGDEPVLVFEGAGRVVRPLAVVGPRRPLLGGAEALQGPTEQDRPPEPAPALASAFSVATACRKCGPKQMSHHVVQVAELLPGRKARDELHHPDVAAHPQRVAHIAAPKVDRVEPIQERLILRHRHQAVDALLSNAGFESLREGFRGRDPRVEALMRKR